MTAPSPAARPLAMYNIRGSRYRSIPARLAASGLTPSAITCRPQVVLVWKMAPTTKTAAAIATGYGIGVPGRRLRPSARKLLSHPLGTSPSLITSVKPRTAVKNPRLTTIGANRSLVASTPWAAPVAPP